LKINCQNQEAIAYSYAPKEVRNLQVMRKRQQRLKKNNKHTSKVVTAWFLGKILATMAPTAGFTITGTTGSNHIGIILSSLYS
jgi:hypothetical protein